MGELQVDGLTKVYETPSGGGLVAVADLDLAVPDGDLVVFVGPSGCGKTTTLRCIAGLESPSEGRILLDGTDITDRDPADRDMAMVFQNFALYPHMTVRRNIGFGLKLRGRLSRAEIDERVEETAELLEISELLEKHPDQLSGGQKQRVALGRAIVREPAVFLFDEPLSNLDAKLRTSMRTEIQRLQTQFDVTSVYVTHDQAEAMTMGDSIAVLNAGRLQQFGTPEEVYNHPANRFVAGFIGDPSMNFLRTTLLEDDGPALAFGDVSYPLTRDTAALVDGEAVTAGIRPEDIHLVDGDEGSADVARFDVEVKVVEPMGDENLVYYDVDDTEFVSKTPARRKPAVGERVELTFAERNLYLFGEDGKTLKSKTATSSSATA